MENYPKDYSKKYWKKLFEEAKESSEEYLGLKGDAVKLGWDMLFFFIFTLLVSYFLGIPTASQITIKEEIYFLPILLTRVLFGVFGLTIYMLLLRKWLAIPIIAFFKKFDLAAKKDFEKEREISELYEGENANIEVKEFNSEGKPSGFTIHNRNNNKDITDIAISIRGIIEHKTELSPKGSGKVFYDIEADNCHFNEWVNGENKIIAEDKNTIFLAHLKNGELYLSSNEGYKLENHSEPFTSNKSKKIFQSRYSLFFDIIGKISNGQKKSFKKETYNAMLTFNKLIEISPEGKVIRENCFYSISDVVRIETEKGVPFGLFLAENFPK